MAAINETVLVAVSTEIVKVDADVDAWIRYNAEQEGALYPDVLREILRDAYNSSKVEKKENE